MSLLDVRHRLIASLVCKRWLKACSEKMDDFQMTFQETFTFPRVPLLTRRFNNVVFRYRCFADEAAEFLNDLGPQLRHLSTYSCKLLFGPGTINCPQLLTLVPDAAANIVVALEPHRLAHLQKLDLTFGVIGVPEMRLIDNIAPNLTEFYMPNNVLPEFRMFSSDSSVLDDAVEAFIAKRAKTLTSLRLGGSADGALRIASTPHLTLTNVDMSSDGFCFHLVRLGEFFQMQPRVEVLNLWNGGIEYEDLETVARLLPGLRVLSVRIMRGNREQEALILLFRLQHLRRLRMEFLPTSDGFVQSFHPDAFSTFKSVDLRVLDLSFPLDHESVRELLTRAPVLRELKMEGLTFVRDGQSIRSVDIRWNREVTRYSRYIRKE